MYEIRYVVLSGEICIACFNDITDARIVWDTFDKRGFVLKSARP